MKTIQDLNLTDLEKQTLQAWLDLSVSRGCEPHFSSIDATCLSEKTGIEKSRIRGVISSLAQKGIFWIEEPNDGGYRIIYLQQDHYYLHPDKYWQAEQV